MPALTGRRASGLPRFHHRQDRRRPLLSTIAPAFRQIDQDAKPRQLPLVQITAIASDPNVATTANPSDISIGDAGDISIGEPAR
jgi:hypothetical protein